jgi:hypothetical protein
MFVMFDWLHGFGYYWFFVMTGAVYVVTIISFALSLVGGLIALLFTPIRLFKRS